MSPTRIVLCSVGNGEDAERIATALVERRLAACVNLVSGVLSIYRWKGAVERDDERLLVIKTSAARFEELRAAIVELHPRGDRLSDRLRGLRAPSRGPSPDPRRPRSRR